MGTSTRCIYRCRVWLLAILIVLGFQSGPVQILHLSSDDGVAAQSRPEVSNPQDENQDTTIYFAIFIHSGGGPITSTQYVYLPSVFVQGGADFADMARAAGTRQGDPPPIRYSSTLSVFNPSKDNPAQITITLVRDDGTVLPSISDTIAPGQEKLYDSTDLVSSDFEGALIIRTDQEVYAAIGVLGDDGAAGFAVFPGTNTGTTNKFFPLVKFDVGGITTNAVCNLALIP
jgi:hypothetical protein